jgi:hypothetical protein
MLSRRDRIAIDEVPDLRSDVVGCHRSKQSAVEPKDERSLSLAQSDGVLGDRVEHRLHVARGAADCFEDFSGRRLLLQGFVTLARTLI